MSDSSEAQTASPPSETNIIIKEIRVRQTYKRTLTGSRSTVAYSDSITDKGYQIMPINTAWVRNVLRLLHNDCIVQAHLVPGKNGGRDTVFNITDARPLAGKSTGAFFETLLPNRDVKWQSKGGHGQADVQTIRDPSTKKIIMRKMASTETAKSFWAQGNVALRVISKKSMLGVTTVLGVVGVEGNLPPRMAK